MIKRTIEISSAPAHLSVRLNQLQLQRGDELVGSIPCEDIGVVVADHQHNTYTHAALASLAECGATVLVCGPDHLPAAMVIPLSDHGQVVWRIQEQLAVGAATRKRLWKQLIQAKIVAQARNLPKDTPARSKLFDLARQVRSGDPSNVEARAARVYWAHWLADQRFRRDPDKVGLNSLLNYGYSVMRASVARSLVAAGLLPALGLHHCNRANAFCLADDLVEPLRPFVDHRVRMFHELGYYDLNRETKAGLLDILVQRVRLGDDAGPMMVAIQGFVDSLVHCYQGDAKKLEIPRTCS